MCPIAVVLADVDLPYWTSKLEHIAAFTAIFGNICTAHAQKRLFMNFRCKFRHRRSIPRPRFPTRVENFGDAFRWLLHFIFWMSAIFRFWFVWPTDLESIPHFKYTTTPTSIMPTKFEPRTPIRSWVMSDNVSHWLPRTHQSWTVLYVFAVHRVSLQYRSIESWQLILRPFPSHR